MDGNTGELVAGVGNQGKVDLREGLVTQDLPAARGFIRAYELQTGALRWTFPTIPQPGEFGCG